MPPEFYGQPEVAWATGWMGRSLPVNKPVGTVIGFRLVANGAHFRLSNGDTYYRKYPASAKTS
jgi:hypothetical protein